MKRIDQDGIHDEGQELRALINPEGFGPIRIINSADGRFKIVDCNTEYGANATATFIYKVAHPLRRELSQAQSLWYRMKNTRELPTPRTILESCPTVAYLCTSDEIAEMMKQPQLPSELAFDVLHRLFPRYSREAIKRMTRSMKRRGMK